jgi:hypothetical protein
MTQLKIWEQIRYRIWKNEIEEISKEVYKVFKERKAADLKAEKLTDNELLQQIYSGII